MYKHKENCGWRAILLYCVKLPPLRMNPPVAMSLYCAHTHTHTHMNNWVTKKIVGWSIFILYIYINIFYIWCLFIIYIYRNIYYIYGVYLYYRNKLREVVYNNICLYNNSYLKSLPPVKLT